MPLRYQRLLTESEPNSYARQSTDTEGGHFHTKATCHQGFLTTALQLSSYFILFVLGLAIGQTMDRARATDSMIDGFLEGCVRRLGRPNKPAEYSVIGTYDHPHQSFTNIVWDQNNSFTLEPSADSERAWMSLIPKGRGFVQHPEIAKVEKSVSVFHELHCLHNIRAAYFTSTYLLSKAHNSSSHLTKSGLEDSRYSYFIDPFILNSYLEDRLKLPEYATSLSGVHVKHCFDYLRQALMCAADSNLEETLMIDGVSATTGMGSVRVCRDFDALKSWSEKWRSSNSSGIV